MSKTFTFEELDKAMTKIDPLGSVMTENQFSRIDEYVGLGNYLLNAQVSGSLFGGIPNSRAIMLSGSSGCLHPDTEIEIYVSKKKVNRKIIKEM